MDTTNTSASGAPSQNELFRSLPKTDELLASPRVEAALAEVPRSVVVDALRGALEAIRERIAGGVQASLVDADAVIDDAMARVATAQQKSLRRVINATGIIIHTNLGRSVLAPQAVEAMAEVAGAYSTLEYDVESGARGSRHSHVESLLCELTGAEAAMAVNNNAAAVVMAIAAFARGKEAIVSRGELIEIGGSFRIPDIMAESGAKMVEVGSTNKTHLKDYRKAINASTGMMLKVHTSNYRVIGFTAEVSLAEMVELGREHGVAVMEDLGSGVLIDLARYGLPHERTVQESLASGADLVTCSGDKLFGGPQAGIILGSREAIARLKSHPLARAMRLDKMTLAALEATLRLYRDPEVAVREIPTLRMLTMDIATCRAQAGALADQLRAALGEAASFEVVDDITRAGGGALPMEDIPTAVVAVEVRGVAAAELERRLRLEPPIPIVVRIRDDRVLVDPRTLLAGDTEALARALAAIAHPGAHDATVARRAAAADEASTDSGR